MQSLQSLRKQIVTFLIITFALSTIFYVLIISAGGLDAPFYVVGLMWCPGIAALLTSLVCRINLREFGWGWGKTRYQVLGYVLPVVYSSIAYGVVWLSGLGGIKEDYPISVGSLVSLATVGVMFSCLSALGEEIGWRGFLVPRLAKITSFSKTSLISGAIWAMWHYPLILFAGYNNPGAPVWYGLLCFTIMAIGLSFVYGWLRLKSGSLWTAMLLHATHNQYVQSLFDQLTVDTGITEFITGEFGAALATAGLIVAFIFWRMRSTLPEPQLEG